jgi:hypothetical protein
MTKASSDLRESIPTKRRAADQKGQSEQPDDPDGDERESSTITDSANAAPLVRTCSEDARVRISTHVVGGSIRG